MAQRKSKTEKWLELALSEDTTRPTLLKPFLSKDDKNLVCCCDGHRIHVTATKNYKKEIEENEKLPTNVFFYPSSGFAEIITINRLDFLKKFDARVSLSLNDRLVAQLEELNKAQKLFEEDKTFHARTMLENEIKHVAKILRAYRTPASTVSLKEFTSNGIDVHLNEKYLIEAVSYDGIGSDNLMIKVDSPLDPVIFKYVDIDYAACIMPVRP
jgi:hypothetical protein